MDFTNWKWINESSIETNGDEVKIYAPANTDWFNNPIPNADGSLSATVANAPFFYTDVEVCFRRLET